MQPRQIKSHSTNGWCTIQPPKCPHCPNALHCTTIARLPIYPFCIILYLYLSLVFSILFPLLFVVACGARSTQKTPFFLSSSQTTKTTSASHTQNTHTPQTPKPTKNKKQKQKKLSNTHPPVPNKSSRPVSLSTRLRLRVVSHHIQHSSPFLISFTTCLVHSHLYPFIPCPSNILHIIRSYALTALQFHSFHHHHHIVHFRLQNIRHYPIAYPLLSYSRPSAPPQKQKGAREQHRYHRVQTLPLF